MAVGSLSNPAGYGPVGMTQGGNRRAAVDAALKKMMQSKKVPRTRGKRTYSYNPKKTNEQSSYPATTG